MSDEFSVEVLREAVEALPDRYIPREQLLLMHPNDAEKVKTVAGMKACPCGGVPECLQGYEPGEEAEKAYLWIIVHGTEPPR